MVVLSSFFFGSLSTILGFKTWKVLYRCFPYFMPMNHPQEKLWIITGATDGIGKKYVEYLAKKGCKILAIGRNENKLKKLQQENS